MGRPIPATDATHGPFKKVVEIVTEAKTFKTFGRPRDQKVVFEVLECGHRGKTLETDLYAGTPTWRLEMIKTAKEKMAKGRLRRRCWECRVAHCDWCGKPTTEDHPLTERIPVWGANDGVHPECLKAYEKERREEEEWTAKVREENLARRRAAGEDPCPDCARDRNVGRNPIGEHVCPRFR